MTTPNIQEARSTARMIVQRIVHDQAFAEQLRTDPHATLLAAGVPDWAVEDFITFDLGFGPEVSGYAVDRCAVTSFLWIDEDGLTAN